MESENTQELSLKRKTIKIPIEKYEKDMDTESVKEKKKEILDLFQNSNNLCSEEEFEEVENKLHRACKEGDVELIKIYLGEKIENESKNLIFKIDKINQTASLFKINSNFEELIIPRTVTYGSTEYLITSICGTTYAFTKSVKFSEDSAVETIYSCAFFYSKIEEIYFPASLKELKEGWCYGADKLTKLIISPSNNQFIFKEDKYLLGKTNNSNDEFDILLFASRDINEISIPSNIKIISPFAFESCRNQTKIEIPTNSQLQTIGSYAFSNSKIKEISIPSNIKIISSYAFSDCRNLTKIEIPTNSQLQTIGSYAFSNSKIKEIYIPSNVSKICESAFSDCQNLTKIEIPTNSQLQIIESNAFSSSKIKQIFIPSNVSKNCGYSFYDCENLIKVEIPTNIKESDIFKNKELIIAPYIDVPIDCSAILSLSICENKINIITKDYKAIVSKNNAYCDFKEHTIKDDDNKICFPISGFECTNYHFYMVSDVENGIKTKLVRNYIFLNIGKFHPVAIFGGSSNCAAIDFKGTILYIPGSYFDLSYELIEPKYLPNKEKAVDIACLSDVLYVLSSKGNLYMSKNANSFNISFKQVEQFNDINVIQISGISNHILVLTKEGKVYSKGRNLFGELGTGDKKDRLRKFVEISSLNQYKITYVSAGENHSLFLTSEGKILSCGKNELNQCFYEKSPNDVSNFLPTETRFQSGAKFCISSINTSAVCIGFDPEMSPNRRVKDEINISLFGCEKKKTEILHAFANNNFENSFINDDNQDEEDYIISLEVYDKVITLRLIDVKNNDNSKEYYQRAHNLIYFFDNSNQSTSTFDELSQIYEESKQIWDNDIKLVFVNCINTNSKKINYDEIQRKYKCETFEIGEDKNIENINKPFFSFLPKIYKNRNEILKIGKEHRNPFDNINKDHINIGIFGSQNVNKTELAFRYIYGEFYKNFYDDFITNFKDKEMDKIVEMKSQYYEISILDSTFVNSKNEDFNSLYSIVQGIVFVYQIDLLSSSDFINEINKYYQNAKDSVKDELNIIIGIRVSTDKEINEMYDNLIDKISEIEKRFESEVILFSVENGENVEDLFYCLIKKIIKNKKRKDSITKNHKTKKAKTKDKKKSKTKTKSKSKK